MADEIVREDSSDPTPPPSQRGYYGLPVLKTPVWRWEVWSYFFLGGLAAGSFLVASLASLFGDARDRSVSRAGYLIAFASVLACPPLLIKDLGRPGRFLNMLRVFKPESPMSLGVWGLVGFSACATLATIRAAFEGSSGPAGALARLLPARGLAALGIALGTFLGGYTGTLLSVTSVPLWSRSRMLGPAFLASAFASGLSAVSLVLALKGSAPSSSLDKIDRAKLAATAGEAIALAAFLRQTGRAVRPVVDPDQFGRHFVMGALGLGIVVPLLASLQGSARNRRSTVLASTCALVGGVLLRCALVEGGRVSAEDPEATFWHTDLPEAKDTR